MQAHKSLQRAGKQEAQSCFLTGHSTDFQAKIMEI